MNRSQTEPMIFLKNQTENQRDDTAGFTRSFALSRRLVSSFGVFQGRYWCLVFLFDSDKGWLISAFRFQRTRRYPRVGVLTGWVKNVPLKLKGRPTLQPLEGKWPQRNKNWFWTCSDKNSAQNSSWFFKLFCESSETKFHYKRLVFTWKC